MAEPSPSIRDIFLAHMPRGCRAPTDRELANLEYLVELTSTASVEITHGKDFHALADAVRTILSIVPRTVEAAEKAAAAAKATGLATGMDRYADGLRALLGAAIALEQLTQRRDIRGAWHGWAALIAIDTRALLTECGMPQVSLSDPTAPAVKIVVDILKIAGVRGAKGKAPEADAVVDALSKTAQAKGGNKR